MPRIGRLHIPGGFYHVMGRGLERRFIFETSVDKRDFLARFGKSIAKADARCLAWALMSNHYHFLVQVGDKPLSKLMASVLGGFAGCYNRRYGRCGYVFQNRFESILIDADSYLLALVRYIHLNPIRAGVVADVTELGNYRWTGHAALFGKHKQDWHSTSAALANFGENKKHARTAYLNFLQAADSAALDFNLAGGGLIRSHGGWQSLEQLRREHIVCIGDERILGSSSFVESALRDDCLSMELRARLTRESWDIERLAEWACKITGAERGKLLVKARGGKLSEAKSLLCYLGMTELGLSLRAIANYLAISQPSVSAWVQKGEAICKKKGLSLGLIDR